MKERRSIRMLRYGMSKENGRERLLYPLNVWALSFGCAVGWGAFVMPGNMFLPTGGPAGTMIAILLSGVIMVVIGANFCRMAEKYRDNGGIYAYTRELLGHDHAFLAAWTIIITYLSIIWANATAVVLLSRLLFGKLLQWGFHYKVAGFDVFFGEILTTWTVILVFGFFCYFGGKARRHLMTALALVLIVSVVMIFLGLIVINRHILFFPPFQQETSPLLQIFSMLMVAPWMFFGYESVTHAGEDFRFPAKKLFSIVVMSVICGTAAYALLNLIAIMSIPPEYSNWQEYIANVKHMQGISALPVFHSVGSTFGMAGIWLVGLSVVSGILTCILGLFRSSAYLLQAMAKDGLLPARYTQVDDAGLPRKAMLLLILASLPIPLLGRTAIVWLVDVITISGSLAYGYVSYCAYLTAKADKSKRGVQLAITGVVASIFFFFCPIMPNMLLGTSLSTESYLLLSVWSIIGLFYYWHIFRHDKKDRYGKSMTMCMMLLFLNFFSTALWMRQSTEDQIALAAQGMYESAREAVLSNNMVQMLFILITLLIMSNIFTQIRHRENKLDEKIRQEEKLSGEKSVFLSHMSHDIRIAIHAIMGYLKLARQAHNDFMECSHVDCPQGVRGRLISYMMKTDSVGHYLEALVQDLLRVEKVENKTIKLLPVATDLRSLMQQARDVFNTQMLEKDLTFNLEVSHLENPCVFCDRERLFRVLLNLISNAYKFTPSGGSIVVSLRQKEEFHAPTRQPIHKEEGNASYEIRVQDTGFGMAEDYAEKLLAPLTGDAPRPPKGSRETGRGIFIVKHILTLMGGTIKVITAPEEGTEFIISLTLPIAKSPVSMPDMEAM